jgi:hypothetical protein
VSNTDIVNIIVKDLFKYRQTNLYYIDKRLTNDKPDLSSEWAPQIRQDCNFKKKYISGQKSQIGLDTKTYWLTDRQPYCNSALLCCQYTLHTQTRVLLEKLTVAQLLYEHFTEHRVYRTPRGRCCVTRLVAAEVSRSR